MSTTPVVADQAPVKSGLSKSEFWLTTALPAVAAGWATFSGESDPVKIATLASASIVVTAYVIGRSLVYAWSAPSNNESVALRNARIEAGRLGEQASHLRALLTASEDRRRRAEQDALQWKTSYDAAVRAAAPVMPVAVPASAPMTS